MLINVNVYSRNIGIPKRVTWFQLLKNTNMSSGFFGARVLDFNCPLSKPFCRSAGVHVKSSSEVVFFFVKTSEAGPVLAMPSSISFRCFVIVLFSLCSWVLLPEETALTGSFGLKDSSCVSDGLGLLLAFLLIFLGLGKKSEDESTPSSLLIKDWLNF